MIKKFIDRLLGKKPAQAAAVSTDAEVRTSNAQATVTLGARVEIAAAEHRIDPQLLDAHAVRVVKTLKEAGYQAYVVGGAVRDLLVGLRPKDFDVATNATPEQVKSLFRRAFIIGRRFRIVHVVFGRGREHETIEVSTFRAYLDAAAAEQVAGNEKSARQMAGKSHVVDQSGRVLRDNVWGPQIEDAARRDFSVNAMYYDPVTQIVVDYHGGLADARARLLRMIGDPETRYREDPVRIIRVVRFAAKLGFSLDPKTEKPLRAMVPLLADVPPSRLFDEMVKLLQTGHALASIEKLKHYGLVGLPKPGPFPVLEAALAGVPSGRLNEPTIDVAQRDAFVRRALQDTDQRVAQDRPVAPSFMLACLLWSEVKQRWASLRSAGVAPTPALQQAVDAVFEARIGDISGRGKLAADMREVWLMQPRFERRTVSGALSLLGQARFRAGYDFLRLRAECGEISGGEALADWWEKLYDSDEEGREALLQELRNGQSGAKGRKPQQSAATTGAADASPTEAEDEYSEESSSGAGADHDQEAPRKRRRRRRRVRTTETAAGGASQMPRPTE